MSFELTCKIISGELGAISFSFMMLSNPPAAVAGGVLAGISGYKLSEPICRQPNRETCSNVYERFEGPNSGCVEYTIAKTTGLPSHVELVKSACLEAGTYYPDVPANPTGSGG